MARISTKDRDEILRATRQKLVDAAAFEFARKGYAEANINQISTAAGFSKGTVYNYFASKQALALALIAEAGAQHVQYITAQVLEKPDARSRLACFFEAGFRFVEEYPLRARFLLATLYSPGAELQQAMAQAYSPMFGLVAQEIVARGIEQGAFRPVDPAGMANLLMTLYLGTGSHVDEQGKVFMDARQVADFAWNALKKV